MTKLKDAPATSLLGFRFWLDRLLREAESLLPAWLSAADFELLPLSPAEHAEHAPYQAIRHGELVRFSRWGLEQSFLKAGFTAEQMCSDKVQRFIRDALPRELALWARLRTYEPSERSRRVWCAAAIYFAFGGGNRSEAARICNLGLSRADQTSGITDEAIRNALHSITRRANPVRPIFRRVIEIETREAVATRLLWNDLGSGLDNVSGRRRIETAEAWRRSGDLYVRFHEHLLAASVDPIQIIRHTIELGKLTLMLRGEHLEGGALPERLASAGAA